MKIANIFLFALLTLFQSCNPFAVNSTTTYWIDEGEHNSISKLSPVYNETLEFIFTFNENNRYLDLIQDDKNKEDINKLYGITSPKIHENSARFGWRQSEISEDEYEVFAYYYILGHRGFKYLCTIKEKSQCVYKVSTVGHYYTFSIYSRTGEPINVEYQVGGTKNIAAYRSFPYFGGNNVCPKDMYFTITEL